TNIPPLSEPASSKPEPAPSQPISQRPFTPAPPPPPLPAQVPSCVLIGKRLENFALNDVDGKPWEYRKDRRGRLVLLDFWGTWCMHCRPAIKHLVQLQNKYGSYGLQVVGIAYEEGSAQEQGTQVKGVAGRMGINYTMLLGTGRTVKCPVREQFNVYAYPT